MKLVTWKRIYSVGIARIDNEHKELIRIFNDLLGAMAVGKGFTVVESIISSLMHYAETHFATEQELMESYNYPGLAKHLNEHEKFREKVQKYKNEFNSGNLNVSIHLINFIKEWLVEHWEGEDNSLGEFLQDQGMD